MLQEADKDKRVKLLQISLKGGKGEVRGRPGRGLVVKHSLTRCQPSSLPCCRPPYDILCNMYSQR